MTEDKNISNAQDGDHEVEKDNDVKEKEESKDGDGSENEGAGDSDSQPPLTRSLKRKRRRESVADAPSTPSTPTIIRPPRRTSRRSSVDISKVTVKTEEEERTGEGSSEGGEKRRGRSSAMKASSSSNTSRTSAPGWLTDSDASMSRASPDRDEDVSDDESISSASGGAIIAQGAGEAGPLIEIVYGAEVATVSIKKELMLEAVSNICAHKYAFIFLDPVSLDEAEDYDDIVRVRVDLQQIQKEIENEELTTVTDLYWKVLLMLQNAFMYNNPDSDVVKMAENLKKFAVKEIESIVEQVAALPPPTRSTPPTSSSSSSSSGPAAGVRKGRRRASLRSSKS